MLREERPARIARAVAARQQGGFIRATAEREGVSKSQGVKDLKGAVVQGWTPEARPDVFVGRDRKSYPAERKQPEGRRVKVFRVLPPPPDPPEPITVSAIRVQRAE